MKTITVELSVAGCNKAIKELKEYQKQIKPKLDEVCRRLAEIGAQEASAIAFAASVQGLGNDDVKIAAPVKIENGYKIVMSGADIYFIEFGTGIFAGEYPAEADVTVGIMPGDWSDTHARKFSDYGYWYYNNQRLEGTPAYMPMFYAGKKMREEMPRVVKEVFGK